MKRQTLLLRFLRLCLSAMLVLVLHGFLADGLGLGRRPAVFGCLPLLTAYFAGSLSSGRKGGWLLLPPACAAAMLLQAAAGTPPALSLQTALHGMDAVLLYILGHDRAEAWPASLGLPAVGLSLLTCAILGWRGQDASFPGACAAATLTVSLLDMHRESMEAGLHNAPGEVPMPYPKGHRRKNLLLLALFFGVALSVAAVPGLEEGADRLWSAAVSGTRELTGNAAAKLRERADAPPHETPPPTPSPVPTPAAEEIGEEAALSGESEGLETALRSSFILLGVLALAALVYLCAGKKGRGFGLRQLRERLRRFFLGSGEEAPYVDQVEKLRPWKDMTEKPWERVTARLRRARKRRARLEDLPDDRARVRYVYGEAVRSPSPVPLSPAMTPTEVGAAYRSEPIRELAEQYNLARYAPEAELSENAAGIAETALGELRTLTRKEAVSRSREKAAAEKKRAAGEKPSKQPVQETGMGETGGTDAEGRGEITAILPAAPVWLPLGSAWDNIRCAARDRGAALRAAELAGLQKAQLRASPRSLTAEQQWRTAIARSLAAEAGRWEADLSLLDGDTAERMAGLLKSLAEDAGVRLTIAPRPSRE